MARLEHILTVEVEVEVQVHQVQRWYRVAEVQRWRVADVQHFIDISLHKELACAFFIVPFDVNSCDLVPVQSVVTL